VPLNNYFDRRIFGPQCPFCANQRMARLDTLARYPVFRCETCGTAIAEFALPSFSASQRTVDPRDPPVVTAGTNTRKPKRQVT